ncbi:MULTISPECIES: CidA/LrgA family protein [Bradyrhizobium]|uniref:CidA/LrgA family protein n=1 Tax=Bradyrhizobium TaxID=374 RepID=UPI00155DE562|nr:MULTISPECIES: CidA/LrgA family protein [Bradyrhizobium]MDD1522997.1 CidA/LrgA family protein [Bradyrhizobium sp. WBAH30]MDD1547076.1 CidA/LrgA family protein [Bradyrhizobium sp. WBAH41]MDD1560652.1 CidA/LrgA family protein [Bradyrhizobium sp. WBAH23]MDD1568121.1 CidA/LrgA family protein [Bradyrhizobium sp. WBAH33]MDD1594070.1 CidA/LrgA family protein [Bradyrhizobium sp. WBAH42]
MIAGLSLILLCQLVGEAIVRGVGLPMPGPVLGMAFLLLLLLTRDHFTALRRGPLQNDAVETTGRSLLGHLSLMFIPAGVGVVKKLDLVIEHGAAILLALSASVVITLLVTVTTFLAVNRLLSRSQPAL